MKVYLMQHGEALSKESDPERPLTAQGEKDVETMALWFKNQSPPLGQIVHSGKRRAEQTAGIVARVVAPDLAIQVQPGLAPNDDAANFGDVLAGWREDSLVVGHLPFLARLVECLLGCADVEGAIAFQPGTLVCLESSSNSAWQLHWMVRPALVKM